MFKKIVLLLGTLPMFACGPSVSAGDLMVFFITIVAGIVAGIVSVVYGIWFLFGRKNKEEEF